MHQASILIVEDEENVGSTLSERLQQDAYNVSWAKDQKTALKIFEEREFDLAILDITLPDGSGWNIGSSIKNRSKSTALIFLTAHSSPEDRIRGLELGAEDYIVKPFHYRELLLRVQNVIKRAAFVRSSASHEAVTIGAAQIWFSKFEASRNGKKTSLSHKESALLKLLHQKKGTAVTRDEILNQVWSQDEYPSTRTIDNFIVRLRRLVEESPEHPQTIRSIRGVGYQLS